MLICQFDVILHVESSFKSCCYFCVYLGSDERRTTVLKLLACFLFLILVLCDRQTLMLNCYYLNNRAKKNQIWSVLFTCAQKHKNVNIVSELSFTRKRKTLWLHFLLTPVVFDPLQGQITLMDAPVFKAIQPEVSIFSWFCFPLCVFFFSLCHKNMHNIVLWISSNLPMPGPRVPTFSQNIFPSTSIRQTDQKWFLNPIMRPAE